MTPAERVRLDRLIANAGMYELPTPGAQPTFAAQWSRSEQPRVWTMDAAGAVSSSWSWLDCTSWTDVVAVRVEWDHGQSIDVAALEADDDDLDGEGH